METWDFQSKKQKSFAGLRFRRSGNMGPTQTKAGYSTSAAIMKKLLTLCLTCTALTCFAQNRPAAPPPPPPPPPPNLAPSGQTAPATTNPGAPANAAPSTQLP